MCCENQAQRQASVGGSTAICAVVPTPEHVTAQIIGRGYGAVHLNLSDPPRCSPCANAVSVKVCSALLGHRRSHAKKAMPSTHKYGAKR